MAIVITLFQLVMSAIYAVFKLLPEKPKKVVFISRQSNILTLDFQLLKSELLKREPGIEIAAICNRMDDKKSGKVRFAVSVFKSMYHLATSKVCVIDSYWPAVSMLKHKKGLTIIQMWHAMGKIKQSGYQNVGKVSGRSVKTAKYMCMHKNYDYIIAGGSAWNEYYLASFNTTEDRLLNIGLPRTDHIINTAESNRKKVLAAYPGLKDKTVVLYAPTFRRNINVERPSLHEFFDDDKYALIVKNHPNDNSKVEGERVLTCPEFTTVDLLSVCDYLITDYSAVAVEGAILNTKTYYFLYDYEAYKEKNGINVDPYESMPGCVFKKPEEIAEAIKSGNYPADVLKSYREKYLPADLGNSTGKLADLIFSKF